MRRISVFLLLFMTALLEVFAQAPQKMSFQAVARKSNNQPVKEETLNVQISILQGSVSGTSVFTETHTVLTDKNGVFNLEIGAGVTVFGEFSGILWEQGPYFLKTEIDADGGLDFMVTGINQLLSVPYAQYAQIAGGLSGGESDPIFEESLAMGITANDTARWNSSGTQLDSAAIVDLGFVAGEHAIDTRLDSVGIASLGYMAGPKTIDTRLDSSAIAAMGFIANPELGVLTELDPVFADSPAGTITSDDVNKWNQASISNDDDPSNEIQVLSYTNGVLTLSKGGGTIDFTLRPDFLWVVAPIHGGASNFFVNACQEACPENYAASADLDGFVCKDTEGGKGRSVRVSNQNYICGDKSLSLCYCVRVN